MPAEAKRLYVVPAPLPGPDGKEIGRKVRDPLRDDHLPPQGRRVPDTPYWRRRLKDGDVLKGTPPAAAEAKAPAKKEAKQ